MTAPNNVAIRPAKLDIDNRPVVRRKPNVLEALTSKHLKMVEAMVWGAADDSVRTILRDGAPLEPGVPLSLSEAAQLVGLRQRGARELMATGLFQAELAREVHRLRMSSKPKAMAKLIELRDATGAGKAADRKVQLAASLALLGEDAGPRASSVQVNINNQVVIPGYIIDLREPGDVTPLQTYSAPIIDGDGQ